MAPTSSTRWWYRKYAPGNTVLEGLEKEARDAKKGLWVDLAPIPPWVFRKAKRGQAIDLSDMVPLDAQPESVAASCDRHVEAATTTLTDSPPSTAPSYNLRLFFVYTHRCTRYNAEAH